MNPISTDIFGRLDWLTKRVKRLCCSVDKVKEDVAAIQESVAGSYKVFTAIYTQRNNPFPDVPTLVNILENTIGGSPTVIYVTSGIYTIDFGSTILTLNKTFATCNTWGDDGSSPIPSSAWPLNDGQSVQIGNNAGFDAAQYISVEVRVYN